MHFLPFATTPLYSSPTSWFHRKYVYQKISSLLPSLDDLISLVKKEIQICTRVEEQYPKNYYAWTHRMYVLQSLQTTIYNNQTTTHIQRSDNIRKFQTLLQEEWSTVEPWLRKHLSDHSAAHFGGCILRMSIWGNQQQLTSILQEEKGASTASQTVREALNIAQKALETARRLIASYPSREVLWIFRRICSHAFVNLIADIFNFEGKNISEAMDVVKESVSAFWADEVKSLLSKDSIITPTVDAYFNGSEEDKERILHQTFRLSYVAWILEIISKDAKKRNILLGICGVQDLEFRDAVGKARSILQASDHIPFNMYRSS